jgi:hypothetical protein
VCGGYRRDQLLDPQRQSLRLGGERIDLVEQQLGELGVVVVEAASERLHQHYPFAPHRAARKLGEHARVSLTRDQRVDHRPRRDAGDVRRDARQLDQRVFEQLLQALHLPRAILDQIDT